MLAVIPESRASASSWRLCDGFHWRLHLHHRSRHAAGLTVSVVRESNYSDVTIGLHVRLVSDHLRKPVRNLSLATKDGFPYERHLDVRMSARAASKSIKLLPIAVPTARFNVEISVDVQDCVMDIGRWSRRQANPCGVTDSVERFMDPYNIERSITWLKDTEVSSIADDLSEKAASDASVTDEEDVSSKRSPVSYSLITLFEACNPGGPVQGVPLTPAFSDVTMVVGSGINTTTFNVHRCVLALASPVFRAMMGSDMLERRTGKVELPNFSPNAIAVAIRHIYGSNVDTSEHLFELYQFAHQFDIISLSEEARRSIIRSLELRNCASLLRFGVAFQDEEIINVSYNLIATRFTDIVADDIAARDLIRIPRATFLHLLEDDKIRASEAELLMITLRWLATNEEKDSTDVLQRIRWGLITPELHSTIENTCLSFCGTSLKASVIESKKLDARDRQFQVDFTTRPRWIGKLQGSLQVSLVSEPPALFLLASPLSKEYRKRKTSGAHLNPSKPTQTSFYHANLKWTLRADLHQHRISSGRSSRLSASLWLEEGNDGKVWTKNGDEALPVHVLANLVVTNCLGGQLHVVPIDVVFRSAGWGSGWCVQDLFDGASHQLSSYGDVVQVAVDFQDMRPA